MEVKAFERRVAKAVGGRRIPVTGIDRDGCDVDGGAFLYQVKLRRGVPGYLRDWLRGICGQADTHVALCAEGSWLPGDQRAPCDCGRPGTGVVIWKEPRARDEDAVVVLRFKDWVNIVHGQAERP